MTINLEKTFTVYQRNACKSIIDDRGREGFGENDLCQKIKPFAEHDLRVTLQRAGKKPFAAQDLRVTLQRAGNYLLFQMSSTRGQRDV